MLVTDLSHVSLSSEHNGLQPIICAGYLYNMAVNDMQPAQACQWDTFSLSQTSRRRVKIWASLSFEYLNTAHRDWIASEVEARIKVNPYPKDSKIR